jgi:AraC-like DNA-binding protein
LNISSAIDTQARDRLVLDLRPLGIPEIPMLGRQHYSHAHGGLEEHAHPGRMEICFLAKGTQLYRMGRRDYVLRGGDIFVAFPDERHSTGEAPQEKALLYWMQIALAAPPSAFLNCAPPDAAKLTTQLMAIRHRHFAGKAYFQALLDEIIQTATAGRNPLRRIAVSSKLIEFLLEVIECSRRNPKHALSSNINNLLRAIEARIEEPLTVGDLAARMGLSVSRFKARFKQEIGIPPAEYVQRCKMAAAKSLLAGRKLTITDIAYRLGFSSSQYFATVFKRYTGQSPRAWRRL